MNIRLDEVQRAFSQEQLTHIFSEVAIGRGRHDRFLRKFAEAVAFVKPEDYALIERACLDLIVKYKLDRFLDTFNGGEPVTI
jgi:predicted nucleic acid-binding OB-fold protein